ncbi:hypothetical protein RFZ45_20065, partial [Acinetobacter baumannii]|nr:hypothetical protein [Acinetobacter baumannii]
MMGLAAVIITTNTVGSGLTPVYAKEMKVTQGNQVVNGIIDFGKGSASITINGNQGQSLAGKKFEVFQLFYAENSKDGES